MYLKDFDSVVGEFFKFRIVNFWKKEGKRKENISLGNAVETFIIASNKLSDFKKLGDRSNLIAGKVDMYLKEGLSKRLEVEREIIKKLTTKGGKFFSNFAGSGTTLVVLKEHKKWVHMGANSLYRILNWQKN